MEYGAESTGVYASRFRISLLPQTSKLVQTEPLRQYLLTTAGLLGQIALFSEQEREREENQADLARQQLYESVALFHACSPGPKQHSLASVLNKEVYYLFNPY
jgi:hypothetical protein